MYYWVRYLTRIKWTRLIISGLFIFGICLPRILVSDEFLSAWMLVYDVLGYITLHFYWGAISTSPLYQTEKGEPACPHCSKRMLGNSETRISGDTRHCHSCHKCILDRDHHCAFTQQCVALSNVKEFAHFVSWAFITLVVWGGALFLNISRIWTMMHDSVALWVLCILYGLMCLAFLWVLTRALIGVSYSYRRWPRQHWFNFFLW